MCVLGHKISTLPCERLNCECVWVLLFVTGLLLVIVAATDDLLY